MSDSQKATRPSNILNSGACVVSMDLYGLFAQIFLLDYQWGSGGVEYATLVSPDVVPDVIRKDVRARLKFIPKAAAKAFTKKKWCLLIGREDSLVNGRFLLDKMRIFDGCASCFAMSLQTPGDRTTQLGGGGMSIQVSREHLESVLADLAFVESVRWQFDLGFLPIDPVLMRQNTQELAAAAASIKARICSLDDFDASERRVLNMLNDVQHAGNPWSFGLLLDCIENAFLFGLCLYDCYQDPVGLWEQCQSAYWNMQVDCSSDRELTVSVNDYCYERESTSPLSLFDELKASEVDLCVKLGLLQLVHARHCQGAGEIEMAISSAIRSKHYAERLIDSGDLGFVTGGEVPSRLFDIGRGVISEEAFQEYLCKRQARVLNKEMRRPNNRGEHADKSAFRSALFALLRRKGSPTKQWASQAAALNDIWADVIPLMKQFNLISGQSEAEIAVFLTGQLERHLPSNLREKFFKRKKKNAPKA